MSWSTIRHTRWLMLVLYSRAMVFFAYFIVYRIVMSLIWKKVFFINKNFFLRRNFISIGKRNIVVILRLILVLRGFAPFLRFRLKLVVLLRMINYFIFYILLRILFARLRAAFFYLRVVQFMSSINRNYLRFRVLRVNRIREGNLDVLLMVVVFVRILFIWV